MTAISFDANLSIAGPGGGNEGLWQQTMGAHHHHHHCDGPQGNGQNGSCGPFQQIEQQLQNLENQVSSLLSSQNNGGSSNSGSNPMGMIMGIASMFIGL